jgi:hypothetical protein
MRNAKYRKYIRSLACLVCSVSRRIEAAHTGPHGLGQKSSDYSCIPLCRKHHIAGNDSIHALGPRKFAIVHGLDIASVVVSLNRQGPLLSSPHRVGRKEHSPEFNRYHCPCGFRTAWCRGEADALSAIHHHIEIEPSRAQHTDPSAPFYVDKELGF